MAEREGEGAKFDELASARPVAETMGRMADCQRELAGLNSELKAKVLIYLRQVLENERVGSGNNGDFNLVGADFALRGEVLFVRGLFNDVGEGFEGEKFSQLCKGVGIDSSWGFDGVSLRIPVAKLDEVTGVDLAAGGGLGQGCEVVEGRISVKILEDCLDVIMYGLSLCDGVGNFLTRLFGDSEDIDWDVDSLEVEDVDGYLFLKGLPLDQEDAHGKTLESLISSRPDVFEVAYANPAGDVSGYKVEARRMSEVFSRVEKPLSEAGG